MLWQQIGGYEYEVDGKGTGYTGWVRCVGGKLADGRWPHWNELTGAKRYG